MKITPLRPVPPLPALGDRGPKADSLAFFPTALRPVGTGSGYGDCKNIQDQVRPDHAPDLALRHDGIATVSKFATGGG